MVTLAVTVGNLESHCCDARSFATKCSFEVKEFSPPLSPKEIEEKEGVDEGANRPEPYQFEPMACE